MSFIILHSEFSICTFTHTFAIGFVRYCFTVYADQLLAKPVTELEKMVTFAGYKPNRDGLLHAVDTYLPTLRAEWNDVSFMQGLHESVRSKYTAAALDALIEKAIYEVHKEMAETQNLTKWPCRSFRDFKDKSMAERLPMPVKALAADCAAKHVKCSVRYDIEEHKRNVA